MTKNKILIDLSESEMTDVGKVDFAQQSTSQEVFSAIWEIESEVNNGGFAEYFADGSAESVHFVVQALETIGAPKTANICSRAIATAFPPGLPELDDALQSAVANFSSKTAEALDSLDQEFFSYPHNLTDLLFSFVNGHPEEFGSLPRPDDA